jgi:hypothetical protein
MHEVYDDGRTPAIHATEVEQKSDQVLTRQPCLRSEGSASPCR